MKRTAGQPDGVAGAKFLRDDVDLVGPDGGAEVGDGGLGNGWPMLPEVYDPANAPRVPDAPQASRQAEAGEQIAGEQRFGEPDRAGTGRAPEADPRQVNLEVQLPLQMGGGDMLVFRLRAQAKPRGQVGVRRSGGGMGRFRFSFWPGRWRNNRGTCSSNSQRSWGGRH